MTIGQDFWLCAPRLKTVWPIVPVVKERSEAFTLRAIKNRHSCQPESAKWQRAHKNASYAFQIMQISRVNFEDQRIARKSLRKPENGLLFRHCCCTHRVAQWWRWVWWSLLVVLCVGVCELCIWQQHEMGWNFCRLLLPPSPQPLLPSSSGLLHILLMQYFAFRFCVLSILLHARNILRSLRSCHCSIIIVCVLAVPCRDHHQIHLPRGLATGSTGLLLHAGPVHAAVHRAAAGADIHLHPHRHCRVGQASTWRGRELARPTHGAVQAQGKFKA